MTELLELVQPYGLGGLLLALVCWMMKRTFDSADIREKQTATNSAEFIKTLEKINSSIDLHDVASKTFHEHVQREHKEMITTLGRINGYKE